VKKTELKSFEKSSHTVVLSTLETPFNFTSEGMFEPFLFFRTKSQKDLGLVQKDASIRLI